MQQLEETIPTHCLFSPLLRFSPSNLRFLNPISLIPPFLNSARYIQTILHPPPFLKTLEATQMNWVHNDEREG